MIIIVITAVVTIIIAVVLILLYCVVRHLFSYFSISSPFSFCEGWVLSWIGKRREGGEVIPIPIKLSYDGARSASLSFSHQLKLAVDSSLLYRLTLLTISLWYPWVRLGVHVVLHKIYWGRKTETVLVFFNLTSIWMEFYVDNFNEHFLKIWI